MNIDWGSRHVNGEAILEGHPPVTATSADSRRIKDKLFSLDLFKFITLKLWAKYSDFFKPLSFEIVCYTAIDNKQITEIGWLKKNALTIKI